MRPMVGQDENLSELQPVVRCAEVADASTLARLRYLMLRHHSGALAEGLARFLTHGARQVFDLPEISSHPI